MGSLSYKNLGICLDQSGIELSEEKLGLLEKHWQMILESNNRFNLTAVKEEEAAEKHYLDSLLLLPYLIGEGSLLDIGSGAGFPGIPLAITEPERRVVLLESREKRAKFLNEVKDTLKLKNLYIINERAERAARIENIRATFSFVTARAVAKLSVLLEYTMPFLKKEGVFLAMKGPALEAEIQEAENALSVLQGKIEKVIKYRLRPEGDERAIVIIRKNGDTDLKYPRREGIPEKRPL